MKQTYDTSGEGKPAVMAAAYRGLQAEIYNLTILMENHRSRIANNRPNSNHAPTHGS